MQTFQQALIEQVLAGTVERQVAANASSNHHDFLVAIDHALKQQNADVAHVHAQEKAAAAEADVPALRVVRPAGA